MFSIAGGIISFFAGLGASLKGRKEFLKKDDPPRAKYLTLPPRKVTEQLPKAKIRELLVNKA